ncbi:UNVERIFIED_ORG: hypothetical protein CLV66_12545 [Actinomadura viridilutea]
MGKHGDSANPKDGKLTKQQSDGTSGSQHGSGKEK